MAEFMTMGAVALGIAVVLLAGAAFAYVLVTFIRSAVAHADGEVDARHGHRDRDYYKGPLRWAYERGRTAHERQQRILMERHREADRG